MTNSGDDWQRSKAGVAREVVGLGEFRERLAKFRKGPGSSRTRPAQTISEAARVLRNPSEVGARGVQLLLPMDRENPIAVLAENAMRRAWKQQIPLTVEATPQDNLRFAVSGICGNGDVLPLSRPERNFCIAIIQAEAEKLGLFVVRTPVEGVLSVTVLHSVPSYPRPQP